MTLALATTQDRPLSPKAIAWRRFRKNKLAIVGGIILILLIVVCFATIPTTMRHYAEQNLDFAKKPPSATYWFGTDTLGRDLLARFLLGGAISLLIGMASAAIAVLIGTSVGVIAGYVGGRTDAILMRLVDVLYGLPYILLVILMRVVLVPDHAAPWINVVVLLIGIGSVSWLTMARVIRGQVMTLRDQPFVEAARAMGLTNARILRRHVMPNLLGTIIVYGTLTLPSAILSESFLSFLGLGIQLPLPSWGNLASDGVEALNPIHVEWWLIVWPCVGLSVALLCLNFVGDGLRDAFDPKAGGNSRG